MPGLTPSAPVARSRTERFDRADFMPRRPRAALPSATTAPQPPAPVLDEEAIARAYLFTLGWPITEIDRLCSASSKKQDA